MLSRSEYTANLQLQSVANLRPVLGQVKPAQKPCIPVWYVLLCVILVALMIGLAVKYG